MGLFRKKTDTPDRINELALEVAALRGRLDASEAARTELEGKLSSIGTDQANLQSRVTSIDELSAQVDELDHRITDVPSPTPPPPPPSTTDPAVAAQRLDELESRLTAIDRLTDRLNALSATVAHQELTAAARDESLASDEALLGDISNRLEDLSAAVANHYTQLASTKESLADIDELRDQVSRLTAAPDTTDERTNERDGADIEEITKQMTQLADRLEALDGRVTNVSVELANQLTELSSDLDQLHSSDSGGGDVDTTLIEERIGSSLESIRNGQERLAAEQARYEIQFRADLADLAERLRRPR
jgi:chromosome segregation ATPase